MPISFRVSESFFQAKPVPPKYPKGKLSKNAKRAWKANCCVYLHLLAMYRWKQKCVQEMQQMVKEFTDSRLGESSYMDMILSPMRCVQVKPND